MFTPKQAVVTCQIQLKAPLHIMFGIVQRHEVVTAVVVWRRLYAESYRRLGNRSSALLIMPCFASSLSTNSFYLLLHPILPVVAQEIQTNVPHTLIKTCPTCCRSLGAILFKSRCIETMGNIICFFSSYVFSDTITIFF